jgi:DNA-binding response OmpR family regulator
MAANHASVLVADDDPLLRSLLEYKLAQCGFSVTTAADGEQALDHVHRNVPDLLVLDCMMPILDGTSVLRQIRESHSPVDLPVIMLTARREEIDIISALELGANDYITKPFILKEIVLRIENLINQNGQKKPGRRARKRKTRLPSVASGDNLKDIAGIGPKLEKSLNSLGVHRFAQIAAWTADDVARLEARPGFKGRIGRDDWIAQAKILAAA